jgi:hypothetical protein
MDSVASYIASIIVGVIIGLILRELAPRPRVVYWLAHTFRFDVEREAITTHAITVQNTGKRRAEAIQIAHASEPSIYQMWPQRVHTAEMRPSGDFDIHVIEVSELGPNEWFTLEFLYLGEQPAEFRYIRSKDGYAQRVSVALQWAVPVWQTRLNIVIYLAGVGFLAYWGFKVLTLLWTALTVRK